MINNEEKVKFLEAHNIDWLSIANILNISYEEVRELSLSGEKV